MKKIINTKEKGFAAIIVSIIMMSVSLTIAFSFINLALNEKRIVSNSINSLKSYYLAEAGIEDMILRNNKGVAMPFSPNDLSLGEGIARQYSGSVVAGTREIICEGNIDGYVRKIKVVLNISTNDASFYYGIQVGDGGMTMENNSRVKGNVFSNASVIASGKGYITDSVTVAGNGNRIENLDVGVNASSHSCKYSDIGETLTYVSGGSLENCNFGLEVKEKPNDIDPLPLPISQNQIDNWKNEASCNNDPNCIFSGDFTVPIGETVSLGPKKIVGNLIVGNNAIFIVTGSIYITGDVAFNNRSLTKLNAGYGSTSGIIVNDGKVIANNRSILQGSGVKGSYIMVLSTNSSLDINSPAIDVGNNTQGAVFYTSTGLLRLHNNTKVREATGYKVHLDNNAEVEYEVGLENISFSSGPSGGWEIVSWRETI